jgi:16S rRNA pseudouridine516 synthase
MNDFFGFLVVGFGAVKHGSAGGGWEAAFCADASAQVKCHFVTPTSSQGCGSLDKPSLWGSLSALKLDRLLARHQHMGRTAAHRLLAQGRVKVDGAVQRDSLWELSRFENVELDGEVIQAGVRAIYLMLHKPVGWLSATKDAEHPTVIDLIDDPDKGSLHLAGRLDRSTSGLVLLTNDGRWSKRVMDAEHRVPKVYRVQTQEPIRAEDVEAFARGFHFHTEDIMTLPARLEIVGEREALLTLHEGRYHQVKRMFHRVQNRVTALHRESVGELSLGQLAPGQWRALAAEEVAGFLATGCD